MSVEVNCPLTSSPPPCTYYRLHEGDYIIVEPRHVNWSSRWDRKGLIHCYIECYWHVHCSNEYIKSWTVETLIHQHWNFISIYFMYWFGEHYSPLIIIRHFILPWFYLLKNILCTRFLCQAITNKCFAICQLPFQICCFHMAGLGGCSSEVERGV